MEFLSRLQVLLNELIKDPQLAQLSFMVLLGAAAFALMLALILIYLGLSDPIRRRVQQLDTQAAGGGTIATEKGEAGKPAGQALRLAESMGYRLLPADKKVRNRTYNQLRHAGIYTPGAVNTFYGAKLGLTLLLPTVAMFSVQLLGASFATVMLVAASAGIVGYVLPSYWLNRAVRRRSTSLRRGLPDTLDLLVVCTEAGLGLVAAIQRVARDQEISQPELAEELNLFGMQTRAGMDVRSALRDMEERTGVEEVRGLVTSLIQSMRFGTSIGTTLRIYADELRDKRTQDAEERAAKVSTKMLFPLVFCVLPSFFVVALGPPLLGAMEAMAGK
ncbi:type II secretion system F family protein [Marinobacter sp. SS21]|uniref:type II secretion system F family protein n=1 Tax=Marinobacter sp. SS21 TaxID=2979460 RepID=UPI00232E54EF|nr:type II secretion system F family protein [Marinobacter sp. SS21]MDC0663758.1 type II secretion system F family protein [Marinobacter sp. SS21]